MADLKTDYKDDVLDTTQNTRRKYQMINNGDGTVSFEDVTEYLQQGDSFGADDINDTNEEVNIINDNLTTINDNLTNLTTTNVIANKAASLTWYDVSSNWLQLNILVYIDASIERVIPLTLDYGVVGNSESYSLRGGYYAGSGNNAYVLVYVYMQPNSSAARVKLAQVIMNGTDYSSTSTISVIALMKPL